MGELQEVLTRIVNRSPSSGDENRTIGSFSRGIYQYFIEREISLPFADTDNQWIDFDQARNLYLQLRPQSGENREGARGE
ncbi:hypothetical protein M1N83_01030 [Dehalococcoidia bacterium]|nr:hypothetical protein [Dehalococcoidia bacterium]